MQRKFKDKTCPKCGKIHNKTGIFCSRSCANSRKFSAEARKKKSVANKQHWNLLSEGEKEEKRQILSKVLNDKSPYNPKNYLKSLFTQDWSALGIQGKRLRTILEQKGCCNKCGISEWNGETITLEFEHKDGNNANNTRDNVEALCPNCHSQTKTWRGRKNKSQQTRIEKYLTMLP